MPYRSRDDRLAYARAYRETNRDRLREQDRVYRAAHKDQVNNRWEEWRRSHPEAAQASLALARRNYAARHPDRLRAKVLRRRALLAGATVERVLPLEVYQRSGGVCGLCSLPVPIEQFDVDHIIPIARGGAHSYANTQASHPVCNRRKRHQPLGMAL